MFDFGNSFRPQTQTIKFVSYCDCEQLDPKKEVADTKINLKKRVVVVVVVAVGVSCTMDTWIVLLEASCMAAEMPRKYV